MSNLSTSKLRPGMKLRCIKTWLDTDEETSIYKGTIYTVNDIRRDDVSLKEIRNGEFYYGFPYFGGKQQFEICDFSEYIKILYKV